MKTNPQWTDLERRRSEWMDALFRRDIGLEVKPSEMEDHAQAVASLAETMAPGSRDDPAAWSLLSNIMMEARLTPRLLEVQKLADQHYTFQDILLDGRPVTPYSRARYLGQENDPQKRREILRRVAEGHPDLDRAWVRYHHLRMELVAQWDYTPLDDVLEGEGLNPAQLRSLLVNLATAMRPSFERHFADNRAAVLAENQGAPWEDFITLYMNRWSASVDRFIPVIDGVAAVRRVARSMGFQVHAITVDLEDRPRKMPGAYAWDVRVPDDIRISVKPIGAVADLTSLYHEMGHALHYVTIPPDLACGQRVALPPGVAETFSFWMQSLLSDPVYLEELGFDERSAGALLRFEQLVRATYATWLSAQALCIMDYWTDGPFTLEELGERLSRNMEQFMGISAPPQAIRVLPTFVRPLNFHTVGYPIAYARLGHLLSRIEAIRADWWHEPAAVDVVRGYMRGGRNPRFPASMLGIGPFVERFADADS